MKRAANNRTGMRGEAEKFSAVRRPFALRVLAQSTQYTHDTRGSRETSEFAFRTAFPNSNDAMQKIG